MNNYLNKLKPCIQLNKKIGFVLIFSISTGVSAQSNEIDLLENIFDKTQEARSPVFQRKEDGRFQMELNSQYKLKEEEILKSGTFIGVIPQGTQLFNVTNEDKIEVSNRKIIARIIKKKDFLGHQFVLNKDGSTTYKVLFSDVVHINNVTSMYEAPLTYKPVIKQDKSTHYNRDFKIQNDFTFSMGLVSPHYTKDVVDEKNLNMTSYHYDAITYANWDFEVKLGLFLGIESSSAKSSRGFVFLDRTFMAGPTIKLDAFDWGDHPVFFRGSFKASLLSNLEVSNQTGSFSYRGSKQALNLALQTVRNYKVFGSFIYGVEVQRTWTKFKSDDYFIDQNRSISYDDSLLFHIGIQKDWL